MRLSRVLRGAFVVSGVVAASAALGQGGGVVVQGDINLYGGSTGTGTTTGVAPSAGNTVERPPGTLPDFVYHAPTAALPAAAGPMPANLNLNVPAGQQTLLRYTATNITPAITIQGGGTVEIHVTGALTLSAGTLTIKDGTRVVFFVDGAVLFDYVSVPAQVGTNSIQIQSPQNVRVNANAFGAAAARANGTLTLQGVISAIPASDGSRASVQQGVQFLRVLPIVEEGA